MGYFEREEWTAGIPTFSSATSPTELRERLKVVHEGTMRDAGALRSLHSFTHKFCREDDRQRNVEVRARSTPLVHHARVTLCPSLLQQCNALGLTSRVPGAALSNGGCLV